MIFKKTIAPALWLFSIIIGISSLIFYSNTAGISTSFSRQWPIESSIPRKPHLPILLIFAHPHCPCTTATLGELERLMPHLQGKSQIFVVFVQSSHHNEAWIKDDLWNKSNRIPGVQSWIDQGGHEADLFEAKTSGQVLLFNAQGDFIFSGGITSSRGHMGDSRGRAQLLNWFESGIIPTDKTPVFGCSLKKGKK